MEAEPFNQWVKFQQSPQNWYPKILITLSYEVSFLSTIVLNEIKSFFCFIPNTDQSSENINHWQLSNHQQVAFTKYKFQTFMTTQNHKQIKNTKNQQKHIIEIPFTPRTDQIRDDSVCFWIYSNNDHSNSAPKPFEASNLPLQSSNLYWYFFETNPKKITKWERIKRMRIWIEKWEA